MKQDRKYQPKLFYSYSHQDSKYRQDMERTLTLLREAGLLDDWYDGQIPPGGHISDRIKNRIEKSDIFAFLLSPNFLASQACRDEWDLAAELANKRKAIVRIPIILAECSWMDLSGASEIKALPRDAKPIRKYRRQEEAWKQIYDGIAEVVNEFQKSFVLKERAERDLQKTDFISQGHVRLSSIFVFPTLTSYVRRGGENVELVVRGEKDLLDGDYVLIHGEELSGKTALARHIFFHLIERSSPVLYCDLSTLPNRFDESILGETYRNYFEGDYSLWKAQPNKTLVCDNLTTGSAAIQLLDLAEKEFDRIIITSSTKTFFAYFRDDERLAKYQEIRILPLSHSKQERLIRKRIQLSGQESTIADGRVDEIEKRVNAVVINNRILPRYPFYILSIIQTYEAFMPNDVSITSYGHCYYVLILAHLRKAGISSTDDEINACLNFSEQLAFSIYQTEYEGGKTGPDFLRVFKANYDKEYVIRKSTRRRMFDPNYGIIGGDGRFRNPYIYYFFIGSYLAKNAQECEEIIAGLLSRSYITQNSLVLRFLIHHSSDENIIDEILLSTMCSLDDLEPATLDSAEAEYFEGLVKSIPLSILSSNSVESERKWERDVRDLREAGDEEEWEDEDDGDISVEDANQIYLVMKNNELLGHVLRTKYGALRRDKIADCVTTIGDSGLRLVRVLLGEREMNELAAYLHERSPEFGIDEMRGMVRFLAFVWTMENIERVVRALNKPEIREVVEEVVAEKGTAAYDLIGYFLRLDTVEVFSDNDFNRLKSIWDKYSYPVLRRVVSLRTQRFLNTHRVHAPIEQKVCSLLGVKYIARQKRLDAKE